MAFVRILAYNEATSKYDIPVSSGDESTPVAIELSKLKSMAQEKKFLVEKVGNDVYQARLAFVNNTNGYWAMAQDTGSGPGAYMASMSLTSFPAFIWLRASCPGGEVVDEDSSVDLKVTANQDYVSLPSISMEDNTAVARVTKYDEFVPDATTYQAKLSAWPDGEVRKVKSITVFVRAGLMGYVYVWGKTASGNNQICKTIKNSNANITLDMASPEPFTEIVLSSYPLGHFDPDTIYSYGGAVSNVIILSDPNPATDVFDTLRELLLIGDQDFETRRELSLPDLIAEFDSEIVEYASTDYGADTSRLLLNDAVETKFDTSIMNAFISELDADTKRMITRIEVLVNDTLRQTGRTGTLSGDTLLQTIFSSDSSFDTVMKTQGYYQEYMDTVRELEMRLIKKNYFFIS